MFLPTILAQMVSNLPKNADARLTRQAIFRLSITDELVRLLVRLALSSPPKQYFWTTYWIRLDTLSGDALRTRVLEGDDNI